jgi:leucyl aminopeptidase (aminopeptidase T)
MNAEEAAQNALRYVLGAEKGESLVIFCDDEKMDVGKAFVSGATNLALKTRLTTLKTEPRAFRKEIPKHVLDILRQQAAIYVNLMRGNLEEAPFRIGLIKLETEGHKARLGHAPGITLDMLTEGALALTEDEHKQMQSFARSLIQKLSKVARIEIRNAAGTSFSLSVEGRSFFTDAAIDRKTMKWLNIPTGEITVAPVENSAQGQLVCDMAAGGIGPLETPVSLTVQNGKVQDAVSKDPKVLSKIRDSLNTDDHSSTIGEFAIGINPKARLSEEFLELEKIFGTIHVAFGNNSDFPGGQNPSRNHLDLLIAKPSVKAFNKDGSSIDILSEGAFQP